MLEKTGVPVPAQVKGATPPKERLARGPVAVIECFQRIPCDPCHSACPTGAIRPFADLNDLPRIDWEACNGCGRCISFCPGLAIFVVDETYGAAEALLKIPWEFSRLPAAGATVTGLDRAGRMAAAARVVKIQPSLKRNRAHILWLAVPREQAFKIRSIALEEVSAGRAGGGGSRAGEAPGETIACRCEEITLGEIRALIAKGFHNIEEIKRLTRAGMGPCQGRTCRAHILRELSRATGKPLAAIEPPVFRPPAKPVSLDLLAGGGRDD